MAGKMEVNMKWLWLLVVPAIIAGSIWWYVSTNAIRQYKAASYEMKLISERQELEIAIYNQSIQLRQIQQQVQQARNPIAPPHKSPVIIESKPPIKQE